MIEAPSGFETIHLNAPNDIQTPGRFITFINTYLKILYKKKKMILEKGDKLKVRQKKISDFPLITMGVFLLNTFL